MRLNTVLSEWRVIRPEHPERVLGCRSGAEFRETNAAGTSFEFMVQTQEVGGANSLAPTKTTHFISLNFFPTDLQSLGIGDLQAVHGGLTPLSARR
jgi:hypothetical protein